MRDQGTGSHSQTAERPAKGSFSTKGQSGEAQGASCCHGNMYSPFLPTSSKADQHLPKKPKVSRESFLDLQVSWISRVRPSPRAPGPGGHGLQKKIRNSEDEYI